MGARTEKDRLGSEAVLNAISSCPGWALGADGLSISKRLLFSDFKEAFRFMTEVAAYSEAVNHHPEWCNVWNRVDMTLTTHTANGVTDLDLAFAEKIESMLASFNVVCDLSDESCGGCR